MIDRERLFCQTCGCVTEHLDYGKEWRAMRFTCAKCGNYAVPTEGKT
jgi:hypothetical protein